MPRRHILTPAQIVETHRRLQERVDRLRDDTFQLSIKVTDALGQEHVIADDWRLSEPEVQVIVRAYYQRMLDQQKAFLKKAGTKDGNSRWWK